MSIRPSNAAIALVVVLAGILLTTLVPQGPFRDLGSAEAANPVTYSYAENGTDGGRRRFSATDQDGGTVTWGAGTAPTTLRPSTISTERGAHLQGLRPDYEAPSSKATGTTGKERNSVQRHREGLRAVSQPAQEQWWSTVTDVDEAGTVTSLDQFQLQVTRTDQGRGSPTRTKGSTTSRRGSGLEWDRTWTAPWTVNISGCDESFRRRGPCDGRRRGQLPAGDGDIQGLVRLGQDGDTWSRTAPSRRQDPWRMPLRRSTDLDQVDGYLWKPGLR